MDESLVTRDIGLIVLFALMVFLFLSNFGILGPVGDVFSDMMFGLFGFMAYFLPIFVFAAVLYYYAHIDDEEMPQKLGAAIGLFLVLSMICELISGDLANRARYDIAGIYTRCSEHKNGGGVLAGSITYLFYHLFKGFGTALILIVITVICVVLLSQRSIIDYMGDQAREVKHKYDQRSYEDRERRREQKRQYEEERARREAEWEAERQRRQEAEASSQEERRPQRSQRTAEQEPKQAGQQMPADTSARFPIYGPANIDYSKDEAKEQKEETPPREEESTAPKEADKAADEIRIHTSNSGKTQTEEEAAPLQTFNMTRGQLADDNGQVMGQEPQEPVEPAPQPEQPAPDPRDQIANIVLTNDPAPENPPAAPKAPAEEPDAGYEEPSDVREYAAETPKEMQPQEDEADYGYVPEPIADPEIDYAPLMEEEPKPVQQAPVKSAAPRQDLHEIHLDMDMPTDVLAQDASAYTNAEDLSEKVIRQGISDVLNESTRQGVQEILSEDEEDAAPVQKRPAPAPVGMPEGPAVKKDYSLNSAFDEPLRFGEEDDEIPTDELAGRKILSFDDEDELSIRPAQERTEEPAAEEPEEAEPSPQPAAEAPLEDEDAPLPMTEDEVKNPEAEDLYQGEAAPAHVEEMRAESHVSRPGTYRAQEQKQQQPKAYETHYDSTEEAFMKARPMPGNSEALTPDPAPAPAPAAKPQTPPAAPVSTGSPSSYEEPVQETVQEPVQDISLHRDGMTQNADNQVVRDTTPSAASVVETRQDLDEAKQQAQLAQKKEERAQAPVQQAKPHREYIFPPMDLLKKPVPYNDEDSAQELRQTAMKLQNTLETFGVRVRITDISQGPTVTRYEMIPEQGVKVSKIVGLADDIKLALAATDIRIEAPIPGKSAVGIEVPNSTPHMVSLREVIDTPEFLHHKSRTVFGVGKDIGGKCVIADIAKMPHVLIAGATGSGKSVCINTIIMSVIYHATPDEVKLIMIDPKVVELSVYNGIPHLMLPVVTDSQKAAATLNWCVAEMEQRFRLFADVGVRDIKGYNALIDEKTKRGENNTGLRHMPSVIIIVDELADLMMVAKSDVETAICRLAQLARAAGMHLVIATQRPSVDVITGLIKANMPSRIAFMVTQGVDSRTILDMNGAEKLLGKGDMLFFPQGIPKPQRVQGAFVSDEEVSRVVDFLKVNDPPAENTKELQKKIDDLAAGSSESGAGQGGDDGKNSEYDELFVDAGNFIIEKQNASIGLLQRRFRIGFNRAARIMDQLCDAGMVGQSEGTKARPILMTQAEFDAWVENNL